MMRELRKRVLVLGLAGFGFTGQSEAGELSELKLTRVLDLEAETTLDGREIRHRKGDVFGLRAGSFRKLTLRHFDGVTFVNHGGLLVLDNREGRGGALNVEACRRVRVTGSGPVGSRQSADPLAAGCGIRLAVGEDGPHAVNVIRRSSSIEMDHLEVFGAGFAGFNVKDEIAVARRGEFTMYNISLHDNYVHDVKGEGFYIGHSFFDGMENKKTGKKDFPHVIKGLRVYNNVTLRTGCEGIQVGSAVEDCEIYNNTVHEAGGSPFAKYQDNGVQIGAGTSARVYNNVILGCRGNAMIVLGGTSQVFNNILAGAGASGVYCNPKDDGVVFFHNTIVNPGVHGIHIGNFLSPPAKGTGVWNNLIVMPHVKKGKEHRSVGVLNQNRRASLDVEGNFETRELDEAGFVDAEQGDYRIRKSSGARGRGAPLSVEGAEKDLFGRTRKRSQAVDAGAVLYAGGPLRDGSGLRYAPKSRVVPRPWKHEDDSMFQSQAK